MQIFSPSKLAKPIDSSCVLWYQGNRSRQYGATLKDLSRYGNNGTITGATWQNISTGAQVLSFDGVDDYVDAGNDTSLNIIGEITLAAWIYPNTGYGNTFPRIINKNFTTSWRMYINASTGKLIQDININGTQRTYTSVSTVSTNNWSNIVVTFNGTTLKMYINNKLDLSDATYTGAIGTDANTVTIGGDSSGIRSLNGFTDDVRIWNRALSASEILEIYQRTRYRYGV